MRYGNHAALLKAPPGGGDSAVLVCVGTGVGTAAAVGGRLLRGSQGLVEGGHIITSPAPAPAAQAAAAAGAAGAAGVVGAGGVAIALPLATRMAVMSRRTAANSRSF